MTMLRPGRFGRALAKIRSDQQKINQCKAMRFLKEARKSINKADDRVNVNRAWRKGAQLESVINFLSSR
jgi:hypothetical protein